MLHSGNTGKSDPNDALSVAVAALWCTTRREVIADDHARGLKVRAKGTVICPGPAARPSAGCTRCYAS